MSPDKTCSPYVSSCWCSDHTDPVYCIPHELRWHRPHRYATVHMVQIRMSLYNRINLICTTPSSVGHSLRAVSQYIKANEQWEWLCMKTKGSGWGETSRLTSFHRHWCRVAAAPHHPATRNQAERFTNRDGVEHWDRPRMCHSRVSQPWSAARHNQHEQGRAG